MGAPRQRGVRTRRAGRRAGLCSLRDPATLRQFLEKLQEGVYITNGRGDILDASPALLAMFGVERLEDLRRFRAADLLVDPAQRRRQMRLLARLGHVRDFELVLRRPDGQVRTVLDTCYTVRDGGRDRLFHGILVDITARKQLEEQLREAGIRDPLTGLHNRRYLMDLAARLEVGKRRWAALVVDIDHFKDYNDRFGHRTGDEVLVRTARFLAYHVRAEDAVVRYGGDEFLILLVGEAAASAARVARRMEAAAPLAAPVPFSLGWARSRRGERVEQTVNRADHRLIRVRARARGLEQRGREPRRP